MPARVLLFTLLFAAPLVARADDLIVLLQQRNCPDCRLVDVDLVHADLRDADLQRAQLQRANLGQARLDGADLSGADLSFTSMQGASLRGTKLHGARLYGTDLRNADLTGAMLDPNALEEAHWSGAKGMQPQAQSHAALHNAGVGAAESDRWKQAENLFGLAISKQTDAAESWVARGIAREKLGKRQLAIQDFIYASNLYAKKGATSHAGQLQTAARSLQDKVNNAQNGNGVGSALLDGLLSTSQALLPLAMKLFMPAISF
ncbi:pentapeptide repeat-containing protein [Synechococcus sp. UW69]|uniref:pentapeptide repeat-containing protein n=1 Tax=Synechococcus sp. UW69 TaxID=368493 RepID=UPI000E0F333C|nr:pentapeptide repeat-containing protein [Synechococcus sp. UW69]